MAGADGLEFFEVDCRLDFWEGDGVKPAVERVADAPPTTEAKNLAELMGKGHGLSKKRRIVMASVRNLGRSRIVGGMRFQINRARSPKGRLCDFSVETSTVNYLSGVERAKEDHEWRACHEENGVRIIIGEPFHGNFSDSGIGG